MIINCDFYACLRSDEPVNKFQKLNILLIRKVAPSQQVFIYFKQILRNNNDICLNKRNKCNGENILILAKYTQIRMIHNLKQSVILYVIIYFRSMQHKHKIIRKQNEKIRLTVQCY